MSDQPAGRHPSHDASIPGFSDALARLSSLAASAGYRVLSIDITPSSTSSSSTTPPHPLPTINFIAPPPTSATTNATTHHHQPPHQHQPQPQPQPQHQHHHQPMRRTTSHYHQPYQKRTSLKRPSVTSLHHVSPPTSPAKRSRLSAPSRSSLPSAFWGTVLEHQNLPANVTKPITTPTATDTPKPLSSPSAPLQVQTQQQQHQQHPLSHEPQTQKTATDAQQTPHDTQPLHRASTLPSVQPFKQQDQHRQHHQQHQQQQPAHSTTSPHISPHARPIPQLHRTLSDRPSSASSGILRKTGNLLSRISPFPSHGAQQQPKQHNQQHQPQLQPQKQPPSLHRHEQLQHPTQQQQQQHQQRQHQPIHKQQQHQKQPQIQQQKQQHPHQEQYQQQRQQPRQAPQPNSNPLPSLQQAAGQTVTLPPVQVLTGGPSSTPHHSSQSASASGGAQGYTSPSGVISPHAPSASQQRNFPRTSPSSQPPTDSSQPYRQHTTMTPHPPKRGRRPSAQSSAPGTTLYKCTFCTTEFRRKSDKTRHIRVVHEKSRPFECDLCGKTFGEKSNMLKHRASVHDDVRTFRCAYCPLVFSQRSLCDAHVKSVHDKKQAKYFCEQCGLPFSRKLLLHEHYANSHPNLLKAYQDYEKSSARAEAVEAAAAAAMAGGSATGSGAASSTQRPLGLTPGAGPSSMVGSAPPVADDNRAWTPHVDMPVVHHPRTLSPATHAQHREDRMLSAPAYDRDTGYRQHVRATDDDEIRPVYKGRDRQEQLSLAAARSRHGRLAFGSSSNTTYGMPVRSEWEVRSDAPTPAAPVSQQHHQQHQQTQPEQQFQGGIAPQPALQSDTQQHGFRQRADRRGGVRVDRLADMAVRSGPGQTVVGRHGDREGSSGREPEFFQAVRESHGPGPGPVTHASGSGSGTAGVGSGSGNVRRHLRWPTAPTASSRAQLVSAGIAVGGIGAARDGATHMVSQASAPPIRDGSSYASASASAGASAGAQDTTHGRGSGQGAPRNESEDMGRSGEEQEGRRREGDGGREQQQHRQRQ